MSKRLVCQWLGQWMQYEIEIKMPTREYNWNDR